MDSCVNKLVSEIESLVRDNSRNQWECPEISIGSEPFGEGICTMKITLDIFVKLHRMLNNFMQLLKFRGPKFCGIDYDKIPLNEALDVAVRAMMAAMCKTTPRRPPSTPVQDENACPGCFKPREVDCVSCRSQGIPQVDEVDRMLEKIREPRGIENPESYVKEVLRTIATLPPTLMIDRLKVLSDHLKKMKNNLVCCGRTHEGSLMEPQMNLISEIVSEFIREYGKRKSEVCPCRTICRFCSSIINTVDRRRGVFCCENARHLNCVWKEWILQNTIQGVAKWDEDTILSILDSMKEKIKQEKCRPGECSQFCQYSKSERGESKGGADRSTDLGKRSFHAEGKKTFDINFDRDKKEGMKNRDLDKVGRRFRDTTEESKKSSGSKARPRDAKNKFEADERFREVKDGKIDRGKDQVERYKQSEGKSKTDKKDKKGEKRADQIDREKKHRNETDHDKDTTGIEKRKKRERSGEDKKRNEKINIQGSKTDDDDDEKTEERTRRRKKSRDTREVKDELDDKTYRKNKAAETISKTDRSMHGEQAKGKEGRSTRSKEKDRREEDSNNRNVGKGRFDLGNKTADFASENMMTIESVINGKGLKSDRLKSPKSKSAEDGYKTSRTVTPNLIEYRLSNELFVNLGWTIIPINRIMQKIVWYQVHLTKPHVNWFKRYGYLGKKYYDDEKTTFLNVHPDGNGEVYYPNGKLAIRIHKPKGQFYDMYTVFTPGGKDVLGIVREAQIMAIFDSIGNGIVFNENSKVRLHYNQNGGICLDNPGGLPFAWIWNNVRRKPVVVSVYTEPSVFHQEKELFLDRSTKDKEPSKLVGNENKIKSVENTKTIDEQPKEIEEAGFVPMQELRTTIRTPIKIICLKLNKHLSLRILDRKNVNLQFFAGNRSIRIELGTELNPNKEVSSYFVDSSQLAEELFKCKFTENILNNVGPESSLYDIAKEYLKTKKIAQQRNAMIAKYKPNMYQKSN